MMTIVMVEVIALGPFRREIGDCLMYGAERYAGTRPGTPVVASMLDVDGEELVARVAAGLGISDPWDFNQHAFTIDQVDGQALRALFTPLEDAADYLADVSRMIRLGMAGFQFILRVEA